MVGKKETRFIPLPIVAGVLGLIIAPVCHSAEESERKTWPRVFYIDDVPIVKVTENPERRLWVYHTKNYEVRSQIEVAPNQLVEIGRVLESVVGVLSAAPFNLIESREKKERHKVLLYATLADFRRDGNPASAAGVYDPRTGLVSILIPALFEEKAPGAKLNPRQRYKVLVHELVHQAMHESLHKLPPWLIEGCAEYFSSMHSLPVGRYEFQKQGISIRDHLKRNLGLRGGSGRARLPSPELVFNASPRAWATDNARGGPDGYHKYATSLLLTHYYFVSGSGAPAMHVYTDSLQHYDRVRNVNTFAEHMLLKELKLPDIEAQLVKYWETQGLHVEFD